MSNIKYLLKTDIATFEIKKEPLGLWDLWVNSMPILTFASPEDAADAVVYVIATFEGADAVEAHGTALATFGTLPMFQSGHIIIEEARSVLDYREWADYLAKRNG